MKLLARMTRARTGLIELAAIALVLALAVNLISSGLVAWLGLPWAALAGLGVAITVILVIAWSQLRQRHEVIEFKGFIPTYDGFPVPVANYALATDVERALRAVTSENAGLKKQWVDGPILLPSSKRESAPEPIDLDGGASRLLREALEYAFLERLSMHLGEYFDGDDWLAKHAKELGRDDLLALLPQNRILDVLSRPLEDRLALAEPSGDDEDEAHHIKITRYRDTPEGREETLMSVWAGDYLYSRFDLSVPKDVNVERVGPGCVRLEGRHMRTELGVAFHGYGYNLDPDFLEGYLNLDPKEFFGGDRGEVWTVTLTFSSYLRWSSLFSARSWRLHRWAEAFANEVRVQLDGQEFLESISWPAISAALRTERGIRNAAKRRANHESAESADDPKEPRDTRPTEKTTDHA